MKNRYYLLILGGVALTTFFYFLFATVTFDYSKVMVFRSSDKEYLSDEVIRKVTDVALSDFNVKIFFAKYNHLDIHAALSYLSSEEVNDLKYATNGDIRAKYEFLPDSSPVLWIWFGPPYAFTDERSDPGPTISVFIEPETYRIYKSTEIF